MATVPDRLYKYLPADGAISLLTTGVFWYRCPLHPAINDPWDSRADLLQNLNLTEARNAYRDELVRLLCDPSPPPKPYALPGDLLHALRVRDRKWTPEDVEIEFGDVIAGSFANWPAIMQRVRDQMKQVLRDVRILCLCENAESDEMWNAYAQDGGGVCMGFRYVPEVDNALGAAEPVRYVESWPVIATPTEWARHILFLEEIPFGPRARSGIYIKLNRWRYEREWRIVLKPTGGTTADADGVYRVLIDPREVVEIILGPSLVSDEADKIREIVKLKYDHACIRTHQQ